MNRYDQNAIPAQQENQPKSTPQPPPPATRGETCGPLPQPGNDAWPPAIRKEYPIDAKERVLVLLALALGILLHEFLFMPENPGLSLLLPVGAFYGVVFWYGRGCDGFSPASGRPYAVAVTLFLGCLVVFANDGLAWLNRLALYGFLTLHAAAMFGHGGRGFPGDLWRSAVRAPFAEAGAVFHTAAAARTGKNARGRKILLGLLLAAPVAAVVIGLLVSADRAFEDAVNRVLRDLGQTVWRAVADLAVGLVLGIFIFSGFYWARRRREQTERRAEEAARPFDATVVSTVIVVCCAIYVCFLIIQFHDLFSAVWGRLPDDTVYSEYARRGFFELTAVAALNLLLLLGAYFSKNRRRASVHISLTALTLLTLALIASAFSKMAMYIRVYGLTPLRLYTSWFMLALAAVFVILLLSHFIKHSNAGRSVVIAMTAALLTLNFAAPDALIARCNAERYLSGQTQTIDMTLFGRLGGGAVPSLLELAQDPGETGRDARYLLRLQDERLSALDWRSMNASALRARWLLDENRALFDQEAIAGDRGHSESDP